MKWIASLSLLLLLAVGLRAAGTDDQYLDIYNQILQADSLKQGGQMPAAALQYRNALTALQKLHDEHPAWNPIVMSFRLNDLTEKVNSLAKYLPAANPTIAIAAQTNAAAADPLAALQAQIQDLSAANIQLQRKLKEALSAKTETAKATAETERLRARLAVLEAAAVPYTAEELAVINAAPKSPVSAPSFVKVGAKRTVHSMTNLPPGAGPLMAEAQRAALERNFALAEKNYQEVLSQDPDNVYVLVSLGNVQFDMGHLEDCEKNTQRAMTLDPQDPNALYLLGILRYRQEKLDECLDALSQSARFGTNASLNATNANTQYALGRVLSDKGLNPAAETAFRKTLQLAPDFVDAHYGLALVYALEKPPSMALARWHYQKSLDLGHPKNSNLEKLLAGDNKP